MEKPQIITSPSGEELVVLPRSDYEHLVDLLAAHKIEAALATRREELLTAEEGERATTRSSGDARCIGIGTP
jgi:PHD/YefM family antitoxin component YafN of YafNO toxin-antitoxin module